MANASAVDVEIRDEEQDDRAHLTEMVFSGYSATRFHLMSACLTFLVDVDGAMAYPFRVLRCGGY